MPSSRPRTRIRKDLTAQNLGINQQQLGQREQIIKENLANTKGVKDPNAVTRSEVLQKQGLPGTPTEQRIAQEKETALREKETANITGVEQQVQSIINPPQQQTPQSQTGFVDEQGRPQPANSQIIQGQEGIARADLEAGALGAIAPAVAVAGVGTAGILASQFIPQLSARTSSAISKISSVGALFGLGTVATAFSAWTAGRQSTFEADIRDLQGSAKEWGKFALNGGDPELAIDNIEDMESEMIRTLGKLHVSLKNDPRGRLKGKDIETFARRQLLALQNKKNAVLRYQATGDSTQLNSIVNTIDANG